MSEQIELFPSISGRIDVKGDVASIKVHCLWTVEVNRGNGWRSNGIETYVTREEARNAARYLRNYSGLQTRIVPYKACYDSKGRKNRQIDSERLDY